MKPVAEIYITWTESRAWLATWGRRVRALWCIGTVADYWRAIDYCETGPGRTYRDRDVEVKF